MSNQTVIARVRGAPIYWDSQCMSFTAGMTIDADGCNGPKQAAYGPNNSGLDWTANAGHDGNWWGIVTEKGIPVIQDGKDESQPCEGFYISTTSYQWPEYRKDDVRRYVDSGTVPFIVLPAFVRELVSPVVLGCACTVTHNGKSIHGVLADFGPATHLGEASIAMAKEFDLNADPREGGTDLPQFLYQIYPGKPAVVNGETYLLIPT